MRVIWNRLTYYYLTQLRDEFNLFYQTNSYDTRGIEFGFGFLISTLTPPEIMVLVSGK